MSESEHKLVCPKCWATQGIPSQPIRQMIVCGDCGQRYVVTLRPEGKLLVESCDSRPWKVAAFFILLIGFVPGIILAFVGGWALWVPTAVVVFPAVGIIGAILLAGIGSILLQLRYLCLHFELRDTRSQPSREQGQ